MFSIQFYFGSLSILNTDKCLKLHNGRRIAYCYKKLKLYERTEGLSENSFVIYERIYEVQYFDDRKCDMQKDYDIVFYPKTFEKNTFV